MGVFVIKEGSFQEKSDVCKVLWCHTGSAS